MSDYLARKKKEREEREALRRNDSTNAGRKTAAGMGNNNINGETLSEWRARQKTGTKYTQNNDSGIRNVYGQTPEEYRKMISSGQSLSEYDKWKGTSEQLLREYDKYSHSGKYQSKESYQSYAKRIENQLKNTVKLKEKNEDKVSEIDEIIQRLSEASGDNDEGYKYFSESENWGDEESFNEYQNALKAAEAEADKKAATRRKDEKNAKRIAAKEVKYSVPENTPGSRSYQSAQSAKDKEAAQEEVEKINESGNLWQYGVNGLNPMGSQAGANYTKNNQNVTDGQKAIATKAVNDKRYSDQLAKYEQEQQDITEKAAQAVNDPDFESKSQYRKSGWTWKGIVPYSSDPDYEYINDADGTYRDTLNHNEGNGIDEFGSEQARKGYDYIEDDEVKVYNYIYETEGRKEAEQYLESLNLTQRMTETKTKEASESADEHPVIESLKTIPKNIFHAGQGYVGDLVDKAQGKPINTNSYANLSMNESNATRNTVTEGIGNPVGQFAYQTAMSMGDFLGTAAVSGVLSQTGVLGELAKFGITEKRLSGFIMGSNAATQGVLEAKERGLSDDQALMTGLAQGIAEEVFEEYSLEKLRVMATTDPKTLKNVFVNVAKQSFTEGSEEFFTDMANALTDLMINGDESENMQKRQAYIDAGYSEWEADKMTFMDYAKQLGLSFAGGAVSGGVMGGLASGIAYNFNKTNMEENVEVEENLQETKENSQEDNEVMPWEEAIETEENATEEKHEEEVPWEEYEEMDPEVYFGQTVENGTDTTENRTEKPEVVPAKPKKRKRQLEKAKKKAGMQQIVKTVLENGKVNDTVANEITKNEDLKAAFEEETGLKLSGSEEQQANAVKEIVRVKAKEAQKPPEIPEFLRIENVKKRRLNSSAETTTTTVQENKTPTGKIIGVEFDKDMSAKFKDDGGKTYTYNEAISKNPEMGDAYITAYRVAIENGTTAAKVFLENYSTNYPLNDYYGGFRMMYNAGRNGIPFEVSVKAASYVRDTIGQTAMKKAWDLGLNAKQAENSKAEVKIKKQKRKGTGIYENQTAERSGGLPELERLVANRTGIDITRKSGLDHNANGSFTASTMTMLLNENAQNEYTALIHELGEFGLAYDRTGMKEVQQMLVKYWTEKNGITGLGEIDSMIEEYQRRYKAVEGSKTRAEAMDEIVNDALGGLFSTDEGVKEFTSWLKTDSGYTKGEQRTIVQRFVDALDSIVKYLKEKIKDMSLSKAARKALELDKQQAENVRKQFLDVLDNAVEEANTTGEYTTDVKEKFSLKEPVEETKDLVAVHNLSETKLLKTMELEGFPMPSIAVTKTEIGHEKFGDISVVFRKETIDPADRRNKVYGADAWTPTFPGIEYEADMDRARTIRSELGKYTVEGVFSGDERAILSGLEYNLNNYGGKEGIIEKALKNYGMKQLYLAQKGEAVKDVSVESKKVMPKEDVEISKEIIAAIEEDVTKVAKESGKNILQKYGEAIKKAAKKAYISMGMSEETAESLVEKYNGLQIAGKLRKAAEYQTNGVETTETKVDVAKTKKAIDSRIDETDYEKWLRKTFEGIEKKSGIYNGKDIFTSGGKRRSFESTHYEYNAENIVKAMLGQSDDVRNVDGFNGMKSIRAVVVDEFTSIEKIKKSGEKITNIDTEQYEELRNSLENRLLNVIKEILNSSKESETSDNSAGINIIGNNILEACKNPTESNIKKVLKKYKWNCTDEQATELARIIKGVKEMPVNMFEAKPQRVVGFDEVAAVLVPNDISEETKNKITEAGMPIMEYTAGDEQSRLEALNEIEDAKFSLPEEYDRVKRENETLLRENETFKQIIDSLEHTLDIKEGIKLNEQSIEKAAKNMLKKYKSNVDQKSFVENVTALFQAAAKNEMSVSDFEYLAESIVRPLIEQSENNLQISDYAKDVLNDIKKTTIKLDGMQKKESAYHYGSYGNLRKSLFGRANFSENGTQLNTLWQQWAETYPDLFDADISPVDQPVKLAEIIKSLKEDYVNECGFDIDDAVSYAAAELLNEYASIPEVENLLDAKKKSEFRVRYRELTNMIKKEYQQRYEGKIKELKQKNAEQISKMSAENRDRLLRQEAKYRSRMAESRDARLERQDRAKYKNSIVKNTKSLLNMLEKNNEKYHVPENLKNITVEFLSTLDFLKDEPSGRYRGIEVGGQWGSREMVQLQLRLNEIYRGFESEINGEGNLAQDIDPDFLPTMNELLGRLRKNMNTKKIAEMDARELGSVAFLVDSLKRAINNQNQLLENKKYEQISEIGDRTIQEMSQKKTKEKSGMVENLLNMDMLDALSFFTELGEGAESIYQEISDAQEKRIWLIKEAQDYMGEITEGKNVKNWTGKNAELIEYEFRGKKYEITVGQLINLYMASKREQGKRHLFGEDGEISQNGGFMLEKGSLVKGQKTPDVNVRMSQKEMNQLFEKLTAEQKEVAEKMGAFMSGPCAQWGNETTMKMYGSKKFVEKNYWTLKTNEDYRRTNDGNVGDNTSLYAIRNMGATKNIDKNARNPLIIGDAFDLFAEHTTAMATYSAYCIPLSDAMKWYNYRSVSEDGKITGTVKEQMSRAYGENAKKYFVNIIKDVNGEMKKGISSEISDTFTSKYKAAAVGGNLRVVIQQPTAYMRASAEIDVGYLARAMLQKPAVKEMQENSAIALWKSWGYFETGLGQSMKKTITGTGTVMENLVEKSMWAAGVADDITWGTLWNAVKLEVADKSKDIDINSEEYMKLVSKRFREVIDKTQVVDTVLHRSQIMRSKDGAVKMATAFMAEPTKTYNLIRNAMLYGDTKTKVRTVAACTATAVVTAAVASVADAFRDDDEEKAWGEKWVENFKANTIDGINPLNNIPYVKEITSFMDGYDSERMDMAGVSSLITGIQQAYKYAKGDSKKTLYGVLKSLARGVSQVSGVPAYNVLRELETLANQFVDIDTNKPTGSTVRIRLLNAMKNNNETQIKKWLEWYDEEYQKKIDAGKTSKEAMSAMKSSIANQYKEIYQKSTTADKIKIKQLLLRIRVGNRQLFNGYDWSSWDKAKKKTEEDD